MLQPIVQGLQENGQDGSICYTFLAILLQRKKNSTHDDFDQFRLFLNPILPKNGQFSIATNQCDNFNFSAHSAT